MSIFYTHRPSYLDSRYGRASIVLIDPLALSGEVGDEAQQLAATMVVEVEKEVMVDEALPAEAPEAEGALGEGRGGQTVPIRVRLDFNPLATFSPEVRTGADGRAVVEVVMPDNLTRYRVMVVAVDEGGNQFWLDGNQHHCPAAADGASITTAFPEFWRPLRITCGAAEPDR